MFTGMLKQKTTFAILDDKPSELKKMAHLVSEIPNTEVVRELRDGDHLLSYLKSAKDLPDFILVDIKINVDYKEGYRIAEIVSQKYEGIRLLLCSEYPDTTYLKEVVAKATAQGFIKKENLASNLKKAIFKICDGGEYWDELPKSAYFKNSNYLNRESRKRLREELDYQRSQKEKTKNPVMDLKDKDIDAYKSQCELQLDFDLTANQWLIFKLFAKGYNAPEIAEKLYTTKESVNVQKGKIKKRLDIDQANDSWLMIKALELGVVEVRIFLEEKANITIIK